MMVMSETPVREPEIIDRVSYTCPGCGAVFGTTGMYGLHARYSCTVISHAKAAPFMDAYVRVADGYGRVVGVDGSQLRVFVAHDMGDRSCRGVYLLETFIHHGDVETIPSEEVGTAVEGIFRRIVDDVMGSMESAKVRGKVG